MHYDLFCQTTYHPFSFLKWTKKIWLPFKKCDGISIHHRNISKLLIGGPIRRLEIVLWCMCRYPHTFTKESQVNYSTYLYTGNFYVTCLDYLYTHVTVSVDIYCYYYKCGHRNVLSKRPVWMSIFQCLLQRSHVIDNFVWYILERIYIGMSCYPMQFIYWIKYSIKLNIFVQIHVHVADSWNTVCE